MGLVSTFQSLMSRFSVQGFPTILVFGADKDHPVPYNGARTASAIESFALEQLEINVSPPEVTELTGPVFLLYSYSCFMGNVVNSYHYSTHFSMSSYRMSWKKNAALLLFALWHFSLTFWTPRQREGTNTLRHCYLLLRSSKRSPTGKCKNVQIILIN